MNFEDYTVLTMEGAMELTGASSSTIRNWCKEEGLHYYLEGKQYRFVLGPLKAFMEGEVYKLYKEGADRKKEKETTEVIQNITQVTLPDMNYGALIGGVKRSVSESFDKNMGLAFGDELINRLAKAFEQWLIERAKLIDAKMENSFQALFKTILSDARAEARKEAINQIGIRVADEPLVESSNDQH